MRDVTDVAEIAAALRVSVGLLRRRLMQAHREGDLTLPERSALARLDREGPSTASVLARAEQISPQSMGETLASLQSRGLVARRADPLDGRRVILSLTDAGRTAVRQRRSEREEQLARALSAEFSVAELAQLAAATRLLERLAQRV